MLKKKSILLGSLLAISLFVTAFVLAGMKQPPREKKVEQKTLQIPVQKVQNEKLILNHSVIGSLQAHEKVELYAEVTGILERVEKQFLEGVDYNKGEVLLQINNTKMRTSLYAKKSGLMTSIAGLLPDLKYDYPESYESWKTYLSQFDIEKSIAAIPQAKNDKEKYFLAGKNIYKTYYDIKSEEEQLTKYTIKAPYKGQVCESNIKAGTVVRTGQKLGEFVNTDTYDLLVGVDLNSLKNIQVGNEVKLYSENINGQWLGKVSRVGHRINAQTQMVNVYISVAGKDLKEGMFLTADIALNSQVNGIEIPRKLLIDDSYVYLLEQGTVVRKEIDIQQYKDDSVIASGIDNGSLLVLKTSGIHKGLKGRAVL